MPFQRIFEEVLCDAQQVTDPSMLPNTGFSYEVEVHFSSIFVAERLQVGCLPPVVGRCLWQVRTFQVCVGGIALSFLLQAGATLFVVGHYGSRDAVKFGIGSCFLAYCCKQATYDVPLI